MYCVPASSIFSTVAKLIVVLNTRAFRGKPDLRRDVIKASYEKAKASGDDNVYYIDGHTLFDGEFYESCTSDGCHPNDIGFLRMADKIGGVIGKVMNLE